MGYVNILRLVFCIVLCLSAGGIGSFFTETSIDSWYSTLRKPPYNPPNWVFGPVWTILYVLMGISFYKIWMVDLRLRANRTQLVLFLAQLILNSLWSIVFFGLEELLLGFGVILCLWALIASTIISFNRLSNGAAILLIPYLMWVSFAALLNYSILVLNA